MNLTTRISAVAAGLLLCASANAINQSLTLIGQPAVAQLGGQGAGNTVVVLESKANISLPLFGSCTSPGVPSTCRIKQAFRVEGGEYIGETSSHGTNVAGIVASVAPMADLILIDGTNSGGLMPAENMVTAVDWAVAHRDQYNIVAINLSYGLKTDSGCGTDNETKVRAAFARARAANISVVLAAGNERLPANLSFPQCAASDGNGIVVGALFDETRYYRTHNYCEGQIYAVVNKIACDSNYGAAVDIFAPGASISFPFAPGDFWGTSHAAPHVAGAIAVLRGPAISQSASTEQVLSLLKASDTYVQDGKTDSRLNYADLVTPTLNLRASYAKGLRDGPLLRAIESDDPAAEPYYVRLAHELLFAYYGRPAEPQMVAILVAGLRLHGMPSDWGRLHAIYGASNYQLNFMIDSFGDREESLRAYPGDNAAFVNGVYRRLVVRDATAAEIANWAGQLDRAEINRGYAILSIVQDIKNTSGTDQAYNLIMLNKMIDVSVGFTSEINTPIEVDSYVGAPAMDKTRAFMSTVNASTSPSRFTWNIINFINSLVVDHEAEIANNPPAPPPPPPPTR